jgi:hypothetical protein
MEAILTGAGVTVHVICAGAAMLTGAACTLIYVCNYTYLVINVSEYNLFKGSSNRIDI